MFIVYYKLRNFVICRNVLSVEMFKQIILTDCHPIRSREREKEREYAKYIPVVNSAQHHLKGINKLFTDCHPIRSGDRWSLKVN